MKLADELIKFFYIDLNEKNQKIRSISDFCKLKPEWENELDLRKVFQTCAKLEQAGYLIGCTTQEKHPILGRGFVSTLYDARRSTYGEYGFVADGFGSIRAAFHTSVLPVEVEKEDGSLDVGTGFLVGNEATFVTARHVIEKKNFVGIRNNAGQYIKISDIIISSDDALDVAILLLAEPLTGSRYLRCTEHAILEDVLCLGYPPIPGFETIILSDISSLSAEIKSSPGRIIGESKSYLDTQEYLLINARVKGGNSGGPVINSKGYVVGVLVQAAMSATEQNSLDQLGYGIVTPHSSWQHLFPKSEGAADKISHLNFENVDAGGFKTC